MQAEVQANMRNVWRRLDGKWSSGVIPDGPDIFWKDMEVEGQFVLIVLVF